MSPGTHPPPTDSPTSSSCMEKVGNTVESTISTFFARVGDVVGTHPRKTIVMAFVLTVLCGVGFVTWETENRGDKLWVPQGTIAEQEGILYERYFGSTTRFNTMIVRAENVLTKERLIEAMKMHRMIETNVSGGGGDGEGVGYTLIDLCARAGGACATPSEAPICQCLVSSILRQWNYNLNLLEQDENVLQTLNQYGTREDLEAVLGNPVFDEDGKLVAAEAFTLSYFLEDRSQVKDGTETDPINEAWEKDVFLATVQQEFQTFSVVFFAARSFEDEFGDAISGDLALVQLSYVMAFLFLGATLGNIRCGEGSRWSMSLAALVTVGLCTAAGFGLSSLFGLFFGPVHSLLPFILLGIGVDDAFVIVNAFNRERKVRRTDETNQDLSKRASRSLARAGASITVTSMTDLVAFAISSSSALPALASFCAYASICIFFLWVFASSFFSACMVLDERRQRDNRRECLCCLTRGKPLEEEPEGFTPKDDVLSNYFRKYHAPVVLSKVGKVIVLVLFGSLLSYGIYGAKNLPVEDTERNFIPEGSYLREFFDVSDELFPSRGIDVFFTFRGSTAIYESRQSLAQLSTRLSGLSENSPYIAEPVSDKAYRNVMAGLEQYLRSVDNTDVIGSIPLGLDQWPTNESDFVKVMSLFASVTGPGARYAQDVAFSEDGQQILAIRVQSQFVRLVKTNRSGQVIDDANRQISAMDDTRALVASWNDLPSPFPFSEKFLTIEGFKVIRRELFLNVSLAIAAVAVIVFLTVANPITASLITFCVGSCIVDILGIMYLLDIVIDSVSVINITLAVGLSVDYSAHIGHCFMVKGGKDKDRRATEALSDIGAAVLNGGLSTFLAVAVLLFSSSYVFKVLSRQFAITVGLGLIHGLVLLPVLLSLVGPKPFSSAENIDDDEGVSKKTVEDRIAATAHLPRQESGGSDDVDGSA